MTEWLAERFEENRAHLRRVAYRMLGSLDDAEDAIQEAWLRVSRAEDSGIENIRGWLTTVTARICLDMLRSRRLKREDSLEVTGPDFIVSREESPEDEVVMADSMGLALLIVLETLTPAERLAFVLHDMFDVAFGEIAAILGCSPEAARQLASRARRRVRGNAPDPDANLNRQREVVDAFLSAVRSGDFEALLAVLDPSVVLHADRGPQASRIVRGAQAVAGQALMFARLAEHVQPVLVNGVAGIVSWRQGGPPFSVVGFTVRQGRIVEIDVLADPERLARIDLRSLRSE